MTLYHTATISSRRYLFLRKIDDTQFQWFEVDNTLTQEKKTTCFGKTPAEAIYYADRLWKQEAFSLIRCGFRYILPGRDGVGCNAFFWQMAKSYNSANGQYFDEEEKCLCYVDFASDQALSLWRAIR